MICSSVHILHAGVQVPNQGAHVVLQLQGTVCQPVGTTATTAHREKGGLNIVLSL